MKLASWMSRLGTETAFEVLAKARALEAAGRDVVHLEIGEPDFDTPPNVRKAAQKALDEGWTHYGPAAGLPEARAAAAEHLSKTRGVSFAPEEVIITPGGKPVMFLAMMALLEPGDEVVYPDPGFPIYESLTRFLGAKAVPAALREENDFAMDMGELERLLNPKTKLLIINSPANPTGGVLSASDLEGLARALKRAPEAMILSDEIYSRIVYEGRHRSIVELPGMKERTILLDGLSKAYAMTGWRVGYGAAPRPLIEAMARLAVNCHSCTASFSQRALIEALAGPQAAVAGMVAEFRKRRDVIVAGLKKIPGFSCRPPSAAFYVFPNITGTGLSSKALADFLLEKAGVACLPGTSFGPRGEGYLRLSYANSAANIAKALDRISSVLPRGALQPSKAPR